MTNSDGSITVTATTNEGTLNATTHTFTDNGSFDFIATDGAGNKTTKTVTINSIDKTAPTLTLAQDVTTPTNKSVKIIATGTDNIAVASITTPDNKVVSGNTATYIVTQNGTYTFKVTDTSGNVTTKSIVVSNIDTTAPVITTSQVTNSDGSITVTATTNEGTLNATTHTFTDNGSFDFIATDSAGNKTTKTVTISSIDKTAPTLTLAQDVTTPTNKSVKITATGADNIAVMSITTPDNKVVNGNTATYNVTANGTYTFKVTDASGNVTTKSIVVSNIDTTAPVITTSQVTNSDGSITVTATTNEGTLNTTTHTFIDNGSFDFIATDGAGNTSTKTVTISSIIKDKTAPTLTLSKDITDETNGSITITANATDDVAVASITEPDNTVINSNTVSYKVNANGTYTFKAIDTSGNVTTQSIIINNIDTTAYKAVSQAESTKTQADVDSAKTLVDALPDGAYKTSLENRLSVVQTAINNQNQLNKDLQDAQNKVTTSESTKTQSDIDIAQTAINKLPDSDDKTNLQARLDKVKADLAYENQLTQATQAVTKAEGSKTQTDVDFARKLVNALPDSSTKTDLSNRLDAVQAIIDKANQDSQNLKKAQDAVTKAENTKTQNDVDSARNLVNSLSDSSAKTDLSNRLDAVQAEIDKANQNATNAQNLKNAQEAVTKAGTTLSNTDVATAQTAINKLPDGTDKTNLQKELDAIKQQIADKNTQDQLAQATKLVTTAEGTKDTSDIAKAQNAVSALPNSKDKDALQSRLDALKAQIAKDAQIQIDLKDATLKVQIAEASVNLSSIKTYITNAQTAIDKLPSCSDKTALQGRLDAINAILANNANKSLAMQAKPLVQFAELYKTTKYINQAWAVVNQMTDCQTKTDYINRLNAIK